MAIVDLKNLGTSVRIAFDNIISAGGAALTQLQSTIQTLANAGGDPAAAATKQELWAATAGLLIPTPAVMDDAEDDVTLTFTAGAATLDGTLGFNFAGTIVANSDVTVIQNLTDRPRRVRITASGGAFTIAFAGAGVRYGFATTVTIPDGDRAVFLVWGPATEQVLFLGLEDTAAGLPQPLGTGDSPQFAGVNLGHASDTTLSRSAAGVIQVEGVPLFSNIPQNSQSAAYTLVIGDAQKHIFHPSADTTARTWTIPANASVAFPVGTSITFINQNAAGVITIAITTDTLRLSPGGTTGSRSLAANGIATAVKVTSTEWIISGSGLT